MENGEIVGDYFKLCVGLWGNRRKKVGWGFRVLIDVGNGDDRSGIYDGRVLV